MPATQNNDNLTPHEQSMQLDRMILENLRDNQNTLQDILRVSVSQSDLQSKTNTLLQTSITTATVSSMREDLRARSREHVLMEERREAQELSITPTMMPEEHRRDRGLFSHRGFGRNNAGGMRTGSLLRFAGGLGIGVVGLLTLLSQSDESLNPEDIDKKLSNIIDFFKTVSTTVGGITSTVDDIIEKLKKETDNPNLVSESLATGAVGGGALGLLRLFIGKKANFFKNIAFITGAAALSEVAAENVRDALDSLGIDGESILDSALGEEGSTQREIVMTAGGAGALYLGGKGIAKLGRATKNAIASRRGAVAQRVKQEVKRRTFTRGPVRGTGGPSQSRMNMAAGIAQSQTKPSKANFFRSGSRSLLSKVPIIGAVATVLFGINQLSELDEAHKNGELTTEEHDSLRGEVVGSLASILGGGAVGAKVGAMGGGFVGGPVGGFFGGLVGGGIGAIAAALGFDFLWNREVDQTEARSRMNEPNIMRNIKTHAELMRAKELQKQRRSKEFDSMIRSDFETGQIYMMNPATQPKSDRVLDQMYDTLEKRGISLPETPTRFFGRTSENINFTGPSSTEPQSLNILSGLIDSNEDLKKAISGLTAVVNDKIPQMIDPIVMTPSTSQSQNPQVFQQQTEIPSVSPMIMNNSGNQTTNNSSNTHMHVPLRAHDPSKNPQNYWLLDQSYGALF